MSIHPVLSVVSFLNHLDKPHKFCLVGYELSAECQMPHFRDIQQGVWSGPPNRVDPFRSAEHAKIVREWFEWRKAMIRKRRDAPAYQTLARLQKVLRLQVVTQCVDGLAGFNGVENVSELYGNVFAARCRQCGHGWIANPVAQQPEQCPHCAGDIWPDVVMFGWNPQENAGSSWGSRLPANSLLLLIGDELDLAPHPDMLAGDMEGCSIIRVSADGFFVTDDDARSHLPSKQIEREMEKHPWPSHLPKLPDQKSLYRSLLSLLWLLEHFKATGSVATPD
jgi:NAD-dependent SIR2 family protein deacetylase